MIIPIDKLPIVIIAIPRSGSTALGSQIQNQFGEGIPHFLDPGYIPGKLTELLNCHENSLNYILKCSFRGTEPYPEDYKNFIFHDPNVYRIRLRRHNMFKQNLSSYIARCSGRWRYVEGVGIPPLEIKVDQSLIEETILWNSQEHTLISNLNLNFDQDLWYEDLSFNNILDVPTPKPTNYDQIFDAFVKTYEQMGATALDE